MLFILLVLTVCVFSSGLSRSTVGSAIFYKKSSDSECWKEEDIAKLKVRSLFEELAPEAVPPEKVTENYLKDVNKYLRQAFDSVDRNVSPKIGRVLRPVLADTFGGHLKSEILPAVRFAYYAGYVPYRDVRSLHDFQEELKTYLNTQGQGWKEPAKVPAWSNITVAKIFIGTGRLLDACENLKTKRDINSCINLPLPKLDDEIKPTTIYLPFKFKGLVSLISPRSENALLKYYTSAARCILQRSPRSCKHSDYVNFNNDMWHWMKESVAPHLVDDKLYSAYGGVLRVAAAVQGYGRGMSRRDLISTQLAEPKKWYPWSYFRESSLDGDEYQWSPACYIFVVFLVAAGIFLLQICYNTLSKLTPCGGRKKPRTSKGGAPKVFKGTAPKTRKSFFKFRGPSTNNKAVSSDIKGTSPNATGPSPNATGLSPTITGTSPDITGLSPSITGPLPDLNEVASTSKESKPKKKSGFPFFRRKKQKFQVEQAMSSSRTKTSLGSARAHKVYDLNENTEKLMELNISEDDSSGSDTSSAHTDIGNEATGTVDQTPTYRNQSPPKIQTPMYQLKVPRPSDRERSRTINSQSSYTQQLSTCREQKLPSSWTGSHTPTGTSSSSESSKTKCSSHGNKLTRDLAWAKSVITKHRSRLSNSRHSVSGTDMTSENFSKN